MNTPAHMILGAAIFARPAARWTNAAALAGGLAPDLSLYVLAGTSLFVMGIPPETVFGQLYFSPGWQAVFAVDHSIPLWSVAVLAALLLRSAVGTAFAASGWLHAAIDLLVHHDDARRQFWPLSDHVFVSPVSYWDPAHYGLIVAPIEVAVCLLLCLGMWRRFRSPWARTLIALAVMAELSPAVMFGMMFAGR